MLNFLRIFRHKNLLKIAVLAALIGFGNSLWSENYIRNENAKSDVLGPYTWSSEVGGGNTKSIWKKESPGGSWGYLTSTPEMNPSDNILFSGECTVIVQLEKDISVDKIIMAYEQGGIYPVTSGAYPVTIDLNGYNLTCNNLILNNNGNFPVNLTITDSNATKGNFIIKNGFDFSDNQTHTINITQGANLKIEGTITGATSGTGSVTIDSSDHTGKLEVTGNVENNGKGFNTNAENLDVTSSIFIWTGAKDTVWEDDANWSTGTVPVETAEVAIPDGLTNYPTIAAGKNIVVKSLAMGNSAEITVEGTLSIDSDFTINNRITGSGSLVVPAGKTYTVPAITVGVGIVNNGTVDCGTRKVVFAKDLANGSSGTFYVASEPGTTTFKGNTDFSAGTLGKSGLYGSEPGTINFYNPITSETDPVKTLKTPSTHLSINNFNFGGKVNIELGAKITTKQLNMDALGVTENFSSKDFTVNISGGEIECTSMNITRASATNDVIGTLNLSTNVKCTGTIQTHSGTNLNNTNGYNFEATTFDHSADNSTPYTKLSVNGTFTVTDFVIQSNNGSTEVEISSTGKLIASNINVNNNKTFKKATKADGSEWSGATGYSITNNGTIQVGTSLNLPASFKIKNNGIIKDKDSSTGATYTFAGTYDNSSTGTLIVDGGSVTNTTAAITISNLTLKNSNTITGTKKITVTNATYTDSTNLAIIGTVELPGVTKGDVTIGNATTAGTTTFTSPYQLDTLTITNGTLTPAASSTNKINTRLTNNGTYTDSTDCTLQLADGATIDGTPASDFNNLPNLTVECLGSATFNCSNIINTLKAESLGGKALTFKTDTFQTVTKLYLSGSSTTNTLSLTGNGSWKINIDDPNNASVKWVTIKNSTANQSSLKQIFAEESFDNGNNTNWDFAITYKWTGAKDTAWENAANWTPKNYGYPGSTTTAHNVLIPDGLAAEKYPVYTNITNKIKTLKIGESDGSAATLTLKANNLQVDDDDAATADLSNYGTIIFTNAGRITDSSTTPVPIMDNEKGTVEYSTGTTFNITDYHNGTNETADYYNLVIKSGTWTIPASATGSNNNIKAANSFTIESGATLVMDDTAEVSTTLINNGTLSIKEDAGAAIWANFTNNGTVLQENSSSLCFTNNCNTVTDNGKWETDADKGTITFIGSDAATFKASENSTYNIVLNNSYKELTFIETKANITKLTVTEAAALKFQCDADIGTFSDTADSSKLEIGYIDASDSSNNKAAKVTINKLDGNTLNSKEVLINSELVFAQNSGVTLGSAGSEITIAGSITAANDITLLGTITSVEVDEANKATLPKITAGTDKAINFGSTPSDQVTYSGPNLYLNSSVNNKAEFINSGTLTANQSFTNNAKFINSGTLTANQSFTNNGSATGTSSSAVLNLKKDFTDNGKWESEETLVINGTETQSFTPQSTGSTYNKILIQKTAAATDHEVIFTAANTLKAKTVTIENNDTTNFNGPVSIETLNDVAASSAAPGSVKINGGGTISTATLNTTGDLTVISAAGLTITKLTHTTGETKVNGKLTLAGDSTVGKITIAETVDELHGASGKTITVLGNWTNNGIFEAEAGIVTFEGNLTVAGSSTFNTANMAGKISITSANQYATLNIYNSSSTDNSDPANPVTVITPSQITFPTGSENVQTVTTKLSLKGNSAEKLLKLKSSSSTLITDTTEADCFYINFTGTITDTDESKNPDIQFVEMTNGYNASASGSGITAIHNYITTYNSVDSGNNYFWNFNGCEYTWTGAKNTDWFTAKNWNRNSVPGKNSIILITEKVNGASVTNWPDLDKSTYPNGVSKVDMGLGEITIGQKAELHINRKNLAASTITNSGLVKIKGTDAAQTITGERVNIAGSTVEYYSGTTATPTINFAWGNEYANLLITDVTNNSSDLEISEKLIINDNTALSGKLAVTGATTIETTENVSLTGSNSLAGGVVINKVNDAVLNNNGTFNLTQTAGADINTLTINSPVTLKTNVITTSSQTYNDEITLTKATELTVSNSTPADLLTINNKLSGSTYALAIDANTSFTSEEKVTAGYIKSAGTKDRTWTSTTKANLDSDLYIDCDTNKIIFDGNFTANNTYMYNGAVTVKSGKTLEALHNLAVWGAAYSATDKRYSANNTRFEYYTAPAFSFAYTQDSRTTTFDSLAGSTIKVCNNFYLNGTDLPSVTLDLPANTSSKPELNTTAAVTEKQWGLPYAAIFNSAITGVTANTGYVTAAIEQGNTDKGGNNQNLQFEIPQIAQAYTVYDDVIYVEFTLPVENAHNEINTNLGAGATAESNGKLSKGGLWYNNKEYRFHPVAYTDKDCTAELEASSEGVTSFYLKTIHTETNTAASYWNTDADGEYAYNQIATNPLESTDRNGIHHNITVDLSMLEGMFTSAKGHTMSSNYGINFEADGSIEAERFTATQDKCSPVLLAVYTGQENHIPDSDIQPDYDAHNFVEFLYSEPVDIGNETTALKAEDGENNIQASATLGGITGAGVGTGITPATGKGLTIAGLAAFTDGRLNSGNKLDSSSPHSLYRNFSTSVSQSAEKQTNRIRVSIAGYVDGTIDGTHKKWAGYIDYSEMPANGSTVRAIENAYLTDTNGNSIDVKGTQTNHKIATEFKLNQGAKNETLNAIYGSWDTSAPVFSQIRKIRNDYADEYEIVPTGNGSVIDKLEFHILDNEENGNNTYFVFTHGWSQMLDAPDSEGYRYSLKPGFQAADKFGGSRAFANGAARTGGGIRYSSYYNMQSAFKFGIHSDAEPVYNFTAITPGATSSYFTGSSNDAYPIPSTDDNNYISLEISGSSYSYEVQFSISYDNTNAYITDLAGNRLQNALMSSIDRTPPDYDITLAPVGGNTHGNGELYIVFVKKLKLENISVGSYTHEKLVDVLPSIVQFGTINSSFTEDTSLKVESAQVYEPLTVTGTHKGDKEFTAFKLTLNRAVTLDDIKTKYIRIAFPASESEYSLDPFTLAAGARVTYIQDFDGISYLQMYKAHPLSDFAINVINPEYAYDPDYTGDNAASMMRSPDDENGSWAVHDWSKDQKNFGTLPYGGQINLITNTTSDGDSDDSNDAGVPATQSFTLYLSKAPTAESVSTHFNNDFDTNKRIWLPQVAGTPAFEPLSDALNENFETVLHTAAPDFDEEKYPNRIQFNFNQKDYDWNSGDQIQFLFGLNGTSIMHNPDNTNDGSSYTGISSPIYALRTSNILNPDIQTLDLWSFKLKAVKTQRGGVSIYNNVINVLKGERTTIKVSMPRKGNLKVIVMTLDGNVISYLENSNNVSGDHIYTWNGTNKKGNMVARGLYFIRVIGEGIDETRKVMCINEK